MSQHTMARTLGIRLLLLSTLAIAEYVNPESEASPLLGSFEKADVNSEEVQRAVDYAVGYHNQVQDNDAYIDDVVDILSAEQQMMAGMKYNLVLEMGRTTCTKFQSNLNNCPLNEEPGQEQRKFCSFEIYDVPWEHKMSMLKYNCKNA
ncbi:cystatin-C-like [Perognathus longimembris pacificus]|uniref:cystatin-C-like n=1 Tax=Perognathus longimembris pacificus TaxID=214514 RepID=UPI00201992CC|nr:cystatin-C-like [Perognathus longimembris pacificus]